MPNPNNPKLVPTAARLARTATGGFSNSLAPALDPTDDVRFIGPDRSWYDLKSTVTNRLRGSDTMYRTVVVYAVHRLTSRRQVLFSTFDRAGAPNAGGWFMAWGNDGAATSFFASVQSSGGPLLARVIYSGGITQRNLPSIGDVLIFTMWTEESEAGLALRVRVRGSNGGTLPQPVNVTPATSAALVSIGDLWQPVLPSGEVGGLPAADFGAIMAVGSDSFSPTLNEVQAYEEEIRARIQSGANLEGMLQLASGDREADELWDARDIDREVGAWQSRVVSSRVLFTPPVVRPEMVQGVPFMMRHDEVR